MRHRRWVSTPPAVTTVVNLDSSFELGIGDVMLEDNEFKERDRRTTIANKNNHKANPVMQNYGWLTKSETFLRNHFK
jgi:hypothetical protein